MKNNKGFTGVDVAIGVIIFTIFISVVAAMFYNISTSQKRVERKAEATNIAINVIESMKAMDFYDLEEDTTLDDINNQIANKIDVPNGYKVTVGVDNTTYKDVLKIISVKVEYENGNQSEDVHLETLVKNLNPMPDGEGTILITHTPTEWTNEIDGNYNNGILGQSEQYNLVTQSSDLITNNEMSIEINDFTLNASTKYNMKAVRTAESDTDTNFYWDIFTNTNSSYFYTTRMTIEDESGIGFGITIGGSNTSPKRDSSIVYYTTGRNNVSVWTHIRPVVTLPESSIDTDIGSGIKGNEWGIKN